MLNLLQEKVVTNHFMLSLPSYVFYLNYLRPTIENGIKCNANVGLRFLKKHRMKVSILSLSDTNPA
jgi:hypothetical protein